MDVIKMQTILPESSLCLSSVPLYYVCGKMIYHEIDLYYTCKVWATYPMAYSRLSTMGYMFITSLPGITASSHYPHSSFLSPAPSP